MKIYIAGPMTGYPEFNRHAFQEIADKFQQQGFEVFNPAVEQEQIPLEGTTGFEKMPDLKAIIRKDVEGILGCDEIYMLQGWEKSTGAKAEHAVAMWLGINIRYQAA